MVPVSLYNSLYLDLYKTDIYRVSSAGPKGVHLKESWLSRQNIPISYIKNISKCTLGNTNYKKQMPHNCQGLFGGLLILAKGNKTNEIADFWGDC